LPAISKGKPLPFAARPSLAPRLCTGVTIEVTTPRTVPELAEALHRAAGHGHAIALGGNGTKHLMGGPVTRAEEAISTTALNRVLNYEPRDLTISVEAGLPWRELTRILAENRQMVPLDPPFAANATVGGVIATN